jgi:hypothetical protein
MDIQKLLEYAQAHCADAIESGSNRDRSLSAQIATACANVAQAMIEYERWQEERLRSERDELLTQRNNEPPF